MSKLRLSRKAFSFLIMVAVFLCVSIPAYASENIQPRAISGAGSIDANKSATFKFYSPGSSSVGNAMIKVKGSPAGKTVFVNVFKPNGESITQMGGFFFDYDQTFYQNFYNAPAGYYTVKVDPLTTGFWFNVVVELNDGYA